MAHPYHHAMSSAKKHGGTPEQYLDIHNWFDETKAWFPDVRHRAIRHHAEGIFECEKLFGTTIRVTLAGGAVKEVPVRIIGEQHVKEDCGWIPNAKDYLKNIKPELWQRSIGVRIDIDAEGNYSETEINNHIYKT